MIPDYIMQLIWMWDASWLIILGCYIAYSRYDFWKQKKSWEEFNKIPRQGGTRAAPEKLRLTKDGECKE